MQVSGMFIYSVHEDKYGSLSAMEYKIEKIWLFLSIMTYFLRIHTYFPNFISHNPEFTSCKLDNISEAFWGFCFVHHKIKNTNCYLYITILRKKSELRDINSEFRLFSHNFVFTSSNSGMKNRLFPHNSEFFHNSRVYTLKKIKSWENLNV